MPESIQDIINQLNQIKKNTDEGAQYAAYAATTMTNLSSQILARTRGSATGAQAANIMQQAKTELDGVANSLRSASSQMQSYIGELRI